MSAVVVMRRRAIDLLLMVGFLKIVACPYVMAPPRTFTMDGRGLESIFIVPKSPGMAWLGWILMGAPLQDGAVSPVGRSLLLCRPHRTGGTFLT